MTHAAVEPCMSNAARLMQSPNRPVFTHRKQVHESTYATHARARGLRNVCADPHICDTMTQAGFSHFATAENAQNHSLYARHWCLYTYGNITHCVRCWHGSGYIDRHARRRKTSRASRKAAKMMEDENDVLRGTTAKGIRERGQRLPVRDTLSPRCVGPST